MTSYSKAEEFNYAYSKNIQPVQLLFSYGMYFDSNPYAIINMPQKSIFHTFTQKQKLLCVAIGCVDPRYYPNEEDQEAIVMGNKEQVLTYTLEQATPINPYHINLFRVFATDERIPNVLGKIAKGLTTKKIQQLLDSDGIISYESEIIAIFNVKIGCSSVLSSKSSVKEDLRDIAQLEKDGYLSDDRKRRQLITLKVAVSNKQTVQVGARAILERGIDLIHRKVVSDLTGSFKQHSIYLQVRT